MNRLVEALHSGRVLLMDGAMGTELQRLGMADDECSALWNLTHPEAVARVHAAYLEAGAEILVTNTFAANPEMLAPFGLQDRLKEIWRAALNNARIFRDAPPIVLADIGPVTNASLAYCDAVDGILLETWSCTSRGQLKPVIDRETATRPLPIILSFTFRRGTDNKLRTIAEAAPEDCALTATYDEPMCAIGANCGNEIDMDDLLDIVRRYNDVCPLPIFIRPNAGTPRRTSTGWEYPRSPEYLADKLWPLLEAGVTMVGGCCGTTPAHIAAFRQVVDEWNGRKN